MTGENKTQEGTYRHAFPSKGCREIERMERGVSNAAQEQVEDTRRHRGAIEQQELPNLKLAECLLEDQPKQNLKSQETDRVVLLHACWGRKAHAERPPSRAFEGARHLS